MRLPQQRWLQCCCSAWKSLLRTSCPALRSTACTTATVSFAGVLASNAFAAANSRVEVVVPEAAPQNTGLLLPTTPSFGSLSAAATAATDLNTPKQAVAATTLPTGPYLPATAALPTRAAPLGIPAAVQPAVAPQLPALGLTVPQAGLQLPAAIQQPQPFPAANPGFIAPANPGFPPLIPGGSGGAAPLGAYPAALPGDGVLGTGKPYSVALSRSCSISPLWPAATKTVSYND